METKLFTMSEVKLSASDSGAKTFSGYGAVFGNIDSHGDVILKGAFADTIATDAVPLMFLNHDLYSLPIGKWTKLEEDDYGLLVEGEFLDTAAGSDAYTAAKAGAITGLSIGYVVVDADILSSGVRSLTSLSLKEISVVTFPSNGLARINEVKSFDADTDHERELVRRGFTIDEAKSFVKTIKDKLEAKYHEAAVNNAALNLLSKLQGAK